MGTKVYHAIVVSSFDSDALAEAHMTARSLFPGDLASGIVSVTVPQRTDSFFIAPDGSNEGWPASDVCDAARERFKRWLHETAFEDGSSLLSWVEVFYDHDNYTGIHRKKAAQVVDHNKMLGVPPEHRGQIEGVTREDFLTVLRKLMKIRDGSDMSYFLSVVYDMHALLGLPKPEGDYTRRWSDQDWANVRE